MIRKTTAAALVLSAVPAALALSLFSGTAQADDTPWGKVIDDDTPWGKVVPNDDTPWKSLSASDDDTPWSKKVTLPELPIDTPWDDDTPWS
ncbi:hypothetical protein [Lentzea sp. NPDC051838]|uniref:hypothetical protein n=1 Tax=Lentzea sp. NPDC051838 TaxID=3154849 RepID=UPI00343076F3